jgi:hypothetical protein
MRAAPLAMSAIRPLLVLSLVWLLDACAAGRVTPVGRFQAIDPALKMIALAPSGGIFADVIGIQLSGQGYTIVDTGATAALLVLMQKAQDELFSPEVMSRLKERGIDAVLVVRKVDGEDGLPQTVQIRLHSTEPVADIGGVDWENGWVRRGMLESAQEIATAMSQGTPPPEPLPAERQPSGL